MILRIRKTSTIGRFGQQPVELGVVKATDSDLTLNLEL
jgi:hypothetical protein